MSDLRTRYLNVHRQGFVPIFVHDAFDARMLADAVVTAGSNVIEITCRRPNALAEIRAVRRAHPTLTILAGSVVDDGPLLNHLQRRQPNMPSIHALLEAGVDGIVSALPLGPATIERVSRTHLVMPGVETASEAVAVVGHGAQFAKLWTADLSGGPARVARLTCAATHGLLPLFVTGGVTVERVGGYINAGAAVVGSGWDVILGADYQLLQKDKAVDPVKLARACEVFFDAVTAARVDSSRWPRSDDPAYAERLSHFVPDAIRTEAT